MRQWYDCTVNLNIFSWCTRRAEAERNRLNRPYTYAANYKVNNFNPFLLWLHKSVFYLFLRYFNLDNPNQMISDSTCSRFDCSGRDIRGRFVRGWIIVWCRFVHSGVVWVRVVWCRAVRDQVVRVRVLWGRVVWGWVVWSWVIWGWVIWGWRSRCQGRIFGVGLGCLGVEYSCSWRVVLSTFFFSIFHTLLEKHIYVMVRLNTKNT